MKVAFYMCFAVLLGCSKPDEQPIVRPVTTEAGVPAPASPRRTVGHRSPFGDAFQSDNLMVDGDFELTGRNDQAPWIVFTNSQQNLDYETGGHCRSGIRCATIAPGAALVGYLASPPVEDFEVRAYLKPDSGHCGDAEVYVFNLVDNNIYGSASSTTQVPGEDGWCFFDGKVTAIVYEQPALFIQLAQNAKAKALVVDQASVLPVSKVPVHGITPPPVVPSAAIRARVATTAAWLRTHRKYGRNVEPVSK
jgi:hypothetical protein